MVVFMLTRTKGTFYIIEMSMIPSVFPFRHSLTYSAALLFRIQNIVQHLTLGRIENGFCSSGRNAYQSEFAFFLRSFDNAHSI